MGRRERDIKRCVRDRKVFVDVKDGRLSKLSSQCENLLMDDGYEEVWARLGLSIVDGVGGSMVSQGCPREQRNMGHIDGLKDKSSLAG